MQPKDLADCIQQSHAAVIHMQHDYGMISEYLLKDFSLFAKSLFAPNLNLVSASRGPVAPSSFKHEALWGCLGVGALASAEKSAFSYPLHDLGLTLKTLHAYIRGFQIQNFF